MKIVICYKCGNLSQLGLTAVCVNNSDDCICDNCSGVRRFSDIGSKTSAWFPNEEYHNYNGIIVYRKDVENKQ